MTASAILSSADACIVDNRLPFDGFRIENGPEGSLLVTHTLGGRAVFWHRYDGVQLSDGKVCTLEGIAGFVDVDPLN